MEVILRRLPPPPIPETPGALEYLQLVDRLARSRGYNALEAARLARLLAQLVGPGRGRDPRALAAATIFWIDTVEAARQQRQRMKPEEAWSLAGSSRASFYRAVRLVAERLGIPHRELLRGGYAYRQLSVYAGRIRAYGFIVVALDGYTPLCRGIETCYVGGTWRSEVGGLVLPARSNGWRAGSVGEHYITAQVKINVYALLTSMRRVFGDREFTTDEFAELMALTPNSAGRLLGKLADMGHVTRVGEGRWRLIS
ncbi:hypothetical protein [Pyrodictium delaneyi]|uniref:Uncharacterized protein n=1 Tax=Pyrodictium delaneyi TaxID=1273541 RepID=A0A211YRA5_9CREN|nr:hypothetical protein [Pyrodictium delaneyi]OWJ55585.1 hypothetical protein Pdsh_02015 [Pyrodictium delaneyi]